MSAPAKAPAATCPECRGLGFVTTRELVSFIGASFLRKVRACEACKNRACPVSVAVSCDSETWAAFEDAAPMAERAPARVGGVMFNAVGDTGEGFWTEAPDAEETAC